MKVMQCNANYAIACMQVSLFLTEFGTGKEKRFALACETASFELYAEGAC